MGSINRRFFFDHAPGQLFGGKLSQPQVPAMGALLDHWEGAYAKKDDPWLAAHAKNFYAAISYTV